MSTNERRSIVWDHHEFKPRLMIDVLCREFERTWHSEQRVSIETFIQRADPAHCELLLPELIAAEWELRSVAGESPLQSDYSSRFPNLTELLTQLETADDLNADESAVSAINSPQSSLHVDDDFSGYRIVRELGHGAMGTVYLAEAPTIGLQVALKILRDRVYANSAVIARFEREAKLLARLDHPGIVPIYAYGESVGIRYLVMKAIDGISLSSAIAGDERSLGHEIGATIRTLNAVGRNELILDIARQLARALQAVHAAEILHRDIKPSNILITHSGQVFLTDFGLAKSEVEGIDLTLDDEFVGTLRYCAPETLDGIYSRQSDIYSLGLVLIELFSLKTPFDSGSRRELLNRKLNSKEPVVTAADTNALQPVMQVLKRMTAHSPESRFPSANDVVEALSACSFSDRHVMSGWRPQLMRTGLVILVSAMLSALIWQLNRSHPDSTASEFTVENLNGVAEVAKSIPLRGSLEFESDWLQREQSLVMPENHPAHHIALSDTGVEILLANRFGQLFSASAETPEIALLRHFDLRQIASIEQSPDGDCFAVCCHDPVTFKNPRADIGSSANRYFVETFSRQRPVWTAVFGAPFYLNSTLPTIVRDTSSMSSRMKLLIPDLANPLIWDGIPRGIIAVDWPEGDRTAITGFKSPLNCVVVAMADGSLHFQGFVAGASRATDRWQIRSEVQSCTSLHFTTDGRSLIAAGPAQNAVVSMDSKDVRLTWNSSELAVEMMANSPDGRWLAVADRKAIRVLDLASYEWCGETLNYQDKILVASPIDNKNEILVVERSGRISLTRVTSDASELLHETQMKTLSAAAFQQKPRRLVIADVDGCVDSFLLPEQQF